MHTYKVSCKLISFVNRNKSLQQSSKNRFNKLYLDFFQCTSLKRDLIHWSLNSNNTFILMLWL